MLDGARERLLRAAGGEHSGDDFVAGERSEGERAHELLGAARHYYLHLDVSLHQSAGQLGGLVSGNAASYSEDDSIQGHYPAGPRAALWPGSRTSPSRAAPPPSR